MLEPELSFRDQAAALFIGAFGKPSVIPVEEGLLYRWKLERSGKTSLAIYVTLDSPEMPEVAHVLISDPSAKNQEPVSSLIMKNLEEVHKGILLIRGHLAGE